MNERKDIDPYKTWVVSDTHFGHENIVRFCHRPPDHDDLMLEQWVQTIPDEDSTVLHLGDLTYRANSFFEELVAPHLTGARKLLILGNHDGQKPAYYERCGFEIIEPFWLRYSIKRINFSHYPWEYHEGPLNGVLVHGHIHNNGYYKETFTPFIPDHINVSIEMMKYRPINLHDLLQGYLFGAGKGGW